MASDRTILADPLTWKYAIFDHYRTWLADDSRYYRLINTHHRPAREWFSKFGQYYQVGRTIPKPNESHYAVIDRFLNEVDANASTDELFAKSRNLAEQLGSIHDAENRRTPWSLATKIIWFRAPRHALINDSLVRLALGCRNPRGTEIVNACQDLFGRNCYELFNLVDAALGGESIFKRLYGSRVIDKLLWIKGNKMLLQRQNKNEELDFDMNADIQDWDAMLPSPISPALQRCAGRIATSFSL